ncbi:hypothetical protein C1J03_13325 [Sulfitobacter sp. SK012]|nr:hypothetical protein C1J03_13325 [Sulfitobacter sp. SK012]
MSKAYFGPRLIFGKAHTDTNDVVAEANYVKDHDFDLMKGNTGIPITPAAQYLVQYRHPLESVQSFFEFQVHHKQLQDTREHWQMFLPKALEYWKGFVFKWCLDPNLPSSCRVHALSYGNLYTNPHKSVADVIDFLTAGREEIDTKKLDHAVEKFTGDFARYVDQEAKGTRPVSQLRDIRTFRYFDDTLPEIERSLVQEYLNPLGLDQKLVD